MMRNITQLVAASLLVSSCFKKIPVHYDGTIFSKNRFPMVNTAFCVSYGLPGKTKNQGIYKAATDSVGHFVLNNNLKYNQTVYEIFVNAGDSGSFSSIPLSVNQSDLSITLQ